jgi:hypothetical protein
VVPRAGVEPARGCPQRFLSSANGAQAVVRERSLQYENRPRVRSSVRRHTPRFALTPVKLLSMRRHLAPPGAPLEGCALKLALEDRFPDTLENKPEVNGSREMLD